MQTHEDTTRHPVGYWSRSLNSAEKNYSTTERECLAVVWGCQILRPYLEGYKFKVYTDHQALKWLLGATDVSGRLARWRLRLVEFDFDIEYKMRNKPQIADALSRIPTDGETLVDPDLEIPVLCTGHLDECEDELCTAHVLEDLLDDEDMLDWYTVYSTEYQLQVGKDRICPEPTENISLVTSAININSDKIQNTSVNSESLLVAPVQPTAVSALTPEEIILAQASDKFCADKLGEVRSGIQSAFRENIKGILVRISPNDYSEQIVLPKPLRQRVLYIAHYSKSAGHPGGTRLYATLRKQFYWPGMAPDAYATVRNCVECAKRRIKLRRHHSFLRLFPAKRPGEHVAIDILGPLPRTQNGYQYVLCMTDRYSKMALVQPLTNITALTVARAFCKEWVYHYGQPTFLLSDRGSQFTSEFFGAVCDTLNVRQAFTSAYHPQTNGQVERFNRTLVASLKCYCSEHGRDWDQFIHAIAYGYNCTVHRATGYTPFDLMLTYPPPHLALQSSEEVDHSDLSVTQAKQRLLTRLKHLMRTSGKALNDAQRRYKANFDERVRPSKHEYKEGDLVFVRREANASGIPDHKLRTEVTDPLPIKRVSRSGRYVVVTLPDGKDSTVSYDRLSPLPKRLVPDRQTQHLTAPPLRDPEPTVPEGENLPALQRRRTRRVKAPGPPRRSPRLNPVVPDVAALEREAQYPPLYRRVFIVSYNKQNLKYRVRWSGLSPQADTYEFAMYLPRAMVQAYRRRHQLPPLANSTWGKFALK